MLTCKKIPFEEKDYWKELFVDSETASFFQSWDWLNLWLKHFGGDAEVIGVWEGSSLIGIGPFLKKEEDISLIGIDPVLGEERVSDFGDIIAKKGREREVWKIVVGYIKDNGWKLNLDFIRSNSPSYNILIELGGQSEEVDVSPFISLPVSWDEYLGMLDRHDRHELRRKLRKLDNEAEFINPYKISDKDIVEFLRLMSLSNEQKRDFLSEKMKDFFSDIFSIFGGNKSAGLYFLKIKNINVSGILAFYFRDEILLYNSGFDPEYAKKSVGMVLKSHLIKQSIEEGKKKFDFLRGNERYKYDFGGRENKLYKIIL
ncbi:GNAT family N-acetyltransferase [Patescibacteria group bacterium]|nr:GNAT family N-acetyltransferase [Patescibacteria group bacterium]MCL5797791.1 GNAT family N-acetyltransferase [Patescibacteria group bacterium]